MIRFRLPRILFPALILIAGLVHSTLGWAQDSSKTVVTTPQVRAELLDMEVFIGLAHAKQLGRAYRRMYNHERPHGSLGMLTPAEWAAQQGRPEPNRQPVV